MNTRFAPATFAFVLATGAAFAIPQNFNQGGFFLGNGIAFENFAANKATWAPGATLTGDWSAPDATGAQTLKEDAVVFGLPAAQITAGRSDDRVIKLRVVFRETEKKSRAALLDRVVQNIRAFTGDAGKVTGKDARTFRNGSVQILARAISAGEVVVEFTPLT